MTDCDCGRPLHYTNPDTQAKVQALVDDLGPTIAVSTPEGTWEIPRHYIALHGLRTEDVPDLAGRYHWEKRNA